MQEKVDARTLKEIDNARWPYWAREWVPRLVHQQLRGTDVSVYMYMLQIYPLVSSQVSVMCGDSNEGSDSKQRAVGTS